MSNEIAGEKLFTERLKAIYRLGAAGQEAQSTDTARAEMLAMFDAFLGENYDSAKRDNVIALQRNLHRGQTMLAKSLEERGLSDSEYVDEFNRLLLTVFVACEQVLGPADFKALFGASPDLMDGFIDKPIFLSFRRAEEGGAARRRKQHRSLSDQTILIVHRSQSQRSALHQTLKSQGCRVLVAEDGWAALQTLRSHEPDVMLVDVKMPTLSGFELVEIVHRRPRTARTLVLMMTSRVTASLQAEAISVGAASVIRNSIPSESLLSEITRRLGAEAR